jgi:hypothetical protein
MPKIDFYNIEDQYHKPDDLVGEICPIEEMAGVFDPYPRGESVSKYNIILYAGDDKTYRVYVRDRDLNPIDLTGAVGVFTLKKYKTDSSATLQKRTDVSGEGQMGAADLGEMLFYILDTDTQSLETRQYVFDVKIKVESGKIYTVLEGTLNLRRPVYEGTI